MTRPPALHSVLLFALLLLAGCSPRNVQEAEGLLVLNVEEIAQGEDVEVCELADTVEVIPLETADDAFFEFHKAFFSPNYIVIKAHNGLVRIFGRDGHFIGLFEGVDEWTFVHDIAIDEKGGAIYASTIRGEELIVFDLTGHRQPGIKLKSPTNKAVLAAHSNGVAVAQFNFYNQPDSFNAAIVGKEHTRYTTRPSLSVGLKNEAGDITGFNYENYVSRSGGALHFMTSFCDTLFCYDTERNSILPELAVKLAGSQGTNRWEAIQNTPQAESWVSVVVLPRHYLVDIAGSNAQQIIVDKERKSAIRASIVGDGLPRLYFADGYAYTLLPPDGKENSTLIRWRLSDKPRHKPARKPTLPQTKNAPVEWDTRPIHTRAFDLSERGEAQAAMQIVDAAIAQAGVKRGHPALAYAYAAKSVLYTQLEQPDSADHYHRLVNARLSNVQQRDINQSLMKTLVEQGRHEEALQMALYLGNDMVAQGAESQFQMYKDGERIKELSQQTQDDSRQLRSLLWALGAVIAAALATVVHLRRQRERHIAATRRELQTLMEQRIESLSADRERSTKSSDELRAEMMKNHALILRISNPGIARPLSDDEEELLHHISRMLYPGLAERLQSKSAAPLSKRELSVCFLFRFGVPQPSVALLLDWKANTFRTVKSHIKREHFGLPADAELEEFIAKA